jgi:hypothetical protein
MYQYVQRRIWLSLKDKAGKILAKYIVLITIKESLSTTMHCAPKPAWRPF